MAKYTFSQEPGLGNVVSSVSPVCNLSKSRPIKTLYDITGKIAAERFSFLCGFMFTSKQPKMAGKKFMIVFCPKITLHRTKGMAGWYCWTINGPKDVDVTSISTMMSRFGFDVTKFFESDLMTSTVAKMKAQVKNALDSSIISDFKTILAKTPNGQSNCKMVDTYVASIRDSLSTIDPTVVEEYAKDYHGNATGEPVAVAKLAYNANADYSLAARDKSAFNQTIAGRNRNVTSQAKAVDAQTAKDAEDIAAAASVVKNVSYDSKADNVARKDNNVFDKYDDLAADYED